MFTRMCNSKMYLMEIKFVEKKLNLNTLFLQLQFRNG